MMLLVPKKATLQHVGMRTKKRHKVFRNFKAKQAFIYETKSGVVCLEMVILKIKVRLKDGHHL